jgi:osmotically-inducible protein OsmY
MPHRWLISCPADFVSTHHSGNKTMSETIKKSDLQIQHDVIEELKWEPSVNAANIGVAVNEGVVTLTGHVPSYAEKWGAEQAVQRVSGVRALAVELEVNLPSLNARDNADIARTATSVVQWSTILPRADIQVMVEKGWLTLTGEVHWDYQRKAIGSLVGHLMGVVGVSNQIVLKPQVQTSLVKAEIETALKRRAKQHAEAIHVQVDNDNITLSGTVHSWADRDLARQSAWATPGVRNVIDNIVISS